MLWLLKKAWEKVEASIVCGLKKKKKELKEACRYEEVHDIALEGL